MRHGKKNPAHGGVSHFMVGGASLDGLHAGCLRSLRALHDLEVHLLSLLQRAETLRVDRGVVHEDVLAALFGQDRAEDLFPFVLVTLVVPLLLLVDHRTRRFGRYMWVGMVGTVVVVLGVGAGVFWLMMR